MQAGKTWLIENTYPSTHPQYLGPLARTLSTLSKSLAVYCPVSMPILCLPGSVLVGLSCPVEPVPSAEIYVAVREEMGRGRHSGTHAFRQGTYARQEQGGL